MAGYRTLAIAAGTGRIGYVYLEDRKLIDWHISEKAASTIDAAANFAKDCIDIFTPELVVTEAINEKCNKGRDTIALIAAIEQTANDAPVLNAAITKAQAYRNKYEEAKALVDEYPELLSRLVETIFPWKKEPRRMILFEALSMALQVRDRDIFA